MSNVEFMHAAAITCITKQRFELHCQRFLRNFVYAELHIVCACLNKIYFRAKLRNYAYIKFTELLNYKMTHVVHTNQIKSNNCKVKLSKIFKI